MRVIDRRTHDCPALANGKPRMRCIDRARRLYELDELTGGTYVLESAGEYWALRSFRAGQVTLPNDTPRSQHECTSGSIWERMFRRDPED